MFPPQVPVALQNRANWIYWQSQVMPNGRLTKVPYQVKNWTRQAASTRAEEWATLHDAAANFTAANRTGLGFVFNAGEGVFGIDVDDIDKVAPEDRDAAMRLRSMIHEHFPTYCEVSPSGTGRHYIGLGSLPEEVTAIKDSKYQIEVYDKQRFFTFTGVIHEAAFTDQLVDCQSALNDLAHTMRGAAETNVKREQTLDPRTPEQVIHEIRQWRNGTDFSFMMDNNLPSILARYRNDHSAADFALANFICQATDDPELAVKIFQLSSLYRKDGKGGYTPEQKYIDAYLIKGCFQRAWSDKTKKESYQKALAEEGKKITAQLMREGEESRTTKGYAKQFGLELPYLDADNLEVQYPPGMAGNYIRAIHNACATPVPEFALAVGMAFLSGVTGRAYRFVGQGLNTFWIVGAKSATGKTQSITALQTLLGGLDNPMLGDRLYAVSGKSVQGLHAYFEKAPAGAWITDECASQVKAMVEPSSQHDFEMKDAVNSLFDAAIPGKRWSPPASVRSQREDKAITSLSVGIGWFTTIDKVKAALSNEEVADGFLSRFIPVFYTGMMGDDNHNQIFEFPPDVKATLAAVWSVVQENDMAMPMEGVANLKKQVTISINSDAKQALDLFANESRNVTRRAQNDDDVMPEAFIALGRVAVTAQRLAAVCAVMDNPIQPTITVEHVKWAIQLVGARMLHILEMLATGEVGRGEGIEVPTVVRIVKRVLAANRGKAPVGLVHDRLRAIYPFKDARIGGMNAAKQALNHLVDEGRIARVTDNPDGSRGRPITHYVPTDDPIWQK